MPRQVPEDYEAKNLTYFPFRFDWQEDFEQLEDDATRWRLVDALIKYAKYGEVPTLEGLSLMAFRHMSQHIKVGLDSARKREYNQERNAERREARKQAKEADFVGELKGEIKNQIEIESKNKIENRNQSRVDAREDDGEMEDDWKDEIDVETEEGLREYIGFLLWKGNSRHNAEDVVQRYLRYLGQFSVDYVLEDLNESIFQGGCDLEEASKEYISEKKRRGAKGLPVLPDSWSAEIEDVFSVLGIGREKMMEYRDTDSRHSVWDALNWISDNLYHGEVTSGQLEAEMQKRRKEKRVEELCKIPNEKLSREILSEFCELKGYTHLDIGAILNTKIHIPWPRFAQICEDKAREEAQGQTGEGRQ